jgi:hypothetical protein
MEGRNWRTYVLMRRILREIENEGCKGWEGSDRWLRRFLVPRRLGRGYHIEMEICIVQQGR